MTESAPAAFILSPQQRWRLAGSPGPEANRSLLLQIGGEARREAIEAALHRLQVRHEILRTRFVAAPGSGTIRQVVDPPGALPWHPLGSRPDASPLDRLSALHHLPFDLERAPSWRIGLDRDASGGFLLGITLGPLINDWGSFRRLLEELALQGPPSESPAPLDEPFQYADYAAWQEDCRAAAEARSPSPAPESPPPPLFPRPAPATPPIASAFLAIDGALPCPPVDPIPFAARGLAAAIVLIGRLTGNHRPTIGVTVDGRTQAETVGLIGLTEKTFPLERSLDEPLSRVEDQIAGWLGERLAAFDRSFPGPAPAAEVRLQVVEFPRLDGASPWRVVPLAGIDSIEAGQRMSLTLLRHGDRLGVAVRTDVSLIDLAPDGFAAFFARQLEALVNRLADHPESLPFSLPLPLPDGSPPGPDLTRPMARTDPPRVTELLARRILDAPEATAVTLGSRSWSYRDLGAAARAVESTLRAGGLEPGDRVALMGGRSFGMIASLVGVLSAGGVIVPIDPALPARHRTDRIRLAAVRLVLGIGEVPELPDGGGIPFLAIDPEGAGPASSLRLQPAPERGPDAPDGDDAYVFFTSGTSAMPKAVLGNHRGLSHFILWQGAAHGVSPADRVAQLTGCSFDVYLRDVFLPLCHGARLCLPEWEGPGAPAPLFHWMARQGVTLAHLVPSVADWWLQSTEPLTPPRSLRIVFFAGEPLTADLVVRWRRRLGDGAEIVNLYGPTETTLAKCHFPVPPVPLPGIQPIGSPIPGAEVFLWNDLGIPCIPGEPGEIVIRTPYRSSGYLPAGAPEDSGFLPNPCRSDPEDWLYRTGDLGRRRLDGLLEIEGRRDDQVKIRGVRVSPRAIEALLNGLPGIRRSVVLNAAAGPDQTPSLVAFALPHPEASPQPRELLAALRRDHPQAWIPDRLVLLDTFPLSPNGKVDRQALLRRIKGPTPGSRDGETPPPTALQQGILDLWAHLFRRDDLGITDDFFDLGGHSLLAAQLVARLRELAGRDVPIGLIFEATTVEALARRLEALPPARRTAPPSIQPSGAVEAPLSHSQKRLWLQHRLEPGLAQYNLPLAVRITGPLDPDRLRACLHRLARRHAILRTVFREAAGNPLQILLPDAIIPFEVLDWRTLPPGERDPALRHRCQADTLRPFDLEAGPPVRAVLARLESEEHVLLLTFHHLVGDGWSSVLLLRDLAAAYDSGAGREGDAEPPPRLQFADFARWEQTAAPSEKHAAGLEHWRRRLEGSSRLPAFPTDRDRPARPSHPGATVSLRLSEDLTARLRDLGRAHGASLFMTLLAAFSAYLHRLTGRTDLILGTPMANRALPETEDLIGCFINPLPMRCRPDGERRFGDWLDAVRRQALEDFQHQDCPYDQIVRIARPERQSNVHPLFQVLLNVLNFDPDPPSAAATRFERIFPSTPPSKFDWTVYVREGRCLDLEILYDRELFEPDRMTVRAAALHRFLDDVAASPHRRIGDYPIDPAAALTGTARPGSAVPLSPPGGLPAAATGDDRLQAAVRAIWARTLQTGGDPDPDADFFELGGHSLMATSLAHQIEVETGVTLPLRMIFEYPTIRRLSAAIANRAWHEGDPGRDQEQWIL